MPLGPDSRRDRLPRPDRELERSAGRLHPGRRIRPQRDRHRDLRLLGDLDVTKRSGFLHDLVAGHRGRRLHHHRLFHRIVGRDRIGRRRKHADRLPLPGLDLDGAMEGEASRNVLHVDPNRPIKTFRPRGGECQFAAAAGADLRILPADGDGERWLRRPNGHRVAEVVGVRGRAKAAGVGEPKAVFAVGRRREEQLRVDPEPLRRIVIVFEKDSHHRQPVGHGLASGRQRLHDPRRLAERVRDGGGAEERLPIPVAGIDREAGVGPLRIPPEPDHLAVRVQIFVEFHLHPVLEPEVGRLG